MPLVNNDFRQQLLQHFDWSKDMPGQKYTDSTLSLLDVQMSLTKNWQITALHNDIVFMLAYLQACITSIHPTPWIRLLKATLYV